MEWNTKRVGLAIAATAIAAVILTAIVLVVTLQLRGYGKIRTIGLEAYADYTGKIKVTEINWGMLSPGEVGQATLFLKNPGNSPVNLTLLSENWTPDNAENFIMLTWNWDMSPLNSSETREFHLYLTVASEIHDIEEFSFDIILIARG